MKIIPFYHIPHLFMLEGHSQDVRSLRRLVSVREVYEAVVATMTVWFTVSL